MSIKITWGYRLTFGRNWGRRLDDVWLDDQEWLLWAVDNVSDKPEIDFLKLRIKEAEARGVELSTAIPDSSKDISSIDIALGRYI